MSEQQGMTNKFGFALIEDDAVPPPPRERDYNPVLWDSLAEFCQQYPGKWVKARTWNKAGSAGVTASNINNDKNKRFPSDKFEARHESQKNDDGSGTSTLYVRFKGEQS